MEDIHGPAITGAGNSEWFKHWEERNRTFEALTKAGEWLHGQSEYYEKSQWYDMSFHTAATFVGYGWFIRLVGAWALKRAVRLLVEWYIERGKNA